MNNHIRKSLHEVRNCLCQLVFLLLVTGPSLIDAQDTDPPVVTCSNVTTIPLLPNSFLGLDLGVTYTYSDANPDPSGVTYNVSEGPFGDLFPPGYTPVTLFAVDTVGNMATCLFFVENPLTELPVNCPSLNRTVSTDPGQATYTFITDFGIDDVTESTPGYRYHGDISVSVTLGGSPDGSSVSIGIHEVAAIISDDVLNKTCRGYYNVQDNQNPTVTCPADFSTNNPVSFTVVATDNADPSPTLTYDPYGPGSDFPVGPTTVIVTATDSSSNQRSCSFTVTVSEPTTSVGTTTRENSGGSASKEIDGSFKENSQDSSADNSSGNDSSNES